MILIWKGCVQGKEKLKFKENRKKSKTEKYIR